MNRPNNIELTRRAEVLASASAWVRAWSPALLLRWCGRHKVMTALAVAALLLVLGAAVAWADDGKGTANADGGDVLISWMGIKDSDNTPVAKYNLTLNEGGWNDVTSTIFAKVASISYEVYLVVTTTALWLIKFVLEFKWLNLFTVPFQTIGNGVNHAMDRFGLAATALAILAIVVVCTALAGRTAKAFSNIAMGMLMIGVAATIFANPISELVGPDGLLAKGRDTGLEIATSVSDGHMSKSGDGANVDAMVSRLADRFLRKPTQMINFGEVSDSVSKACRQAWSEGIKKEHGDKLKDDIKGCDTVKGKAMHQKSMGNPAAILVPLQICGLLALFLVAFACYFVWHVVKAAVQAMLFAALAPPAFAIGVIPGGAQMFAWKTVLDMFMAYAAMVIYTAAFGAYNVILDQVFKDSSNAIESMFMTALVLAFGFAVFGPLRRMFDRQRDTMAAKLSGHGSSGGSGRGLLNNIADFSRARSEIADQFGWNRGGRDGGARAPGRVDSESESSSASGGDGGNGGGGGDGGGSGGPSGAPTVGDAASGAPTGSGADSDAGGVGTDGSGDSGGDGAGREHAAPEQQPAYASDAGGGRLAAAIRIYRATRGGGAGDDPHGAYSGAGHGSDGRYSMSEAA
ncbi:hypothetical protein [Mycobacterium sp. SMC-13]|uniref:hypothetical protein n=1 Tax=Mycobacterium sp. SMC-13 TaxID=3381626 RepID=UPI003877063B